MQIERALFDEAAYLRRYPDVAKHVREGTMSAWLHYQRHGQSEGRRLCDFDEQFYLRSYPLAAEEIAAGKAADALQHYALLGKARGYIPHAKAPRPDNAAALPTPFGGFWFDQPNVADIIAGKLETGQITEAQAALVERFAADGYVILEKAIPAEVIERATVAFDAAYSGAFPELMFECYAVAKNYIPWQEEIIPHPTKALDIHHFSGAIRDLIFADRVAAFLGLLFDSKTLATQTLGFLRGSAQPGHQDSAYVAYTIPRQFAASWIALEDVKIGAGELFYYPGSHKFDDYLYADRFKSVAEARRMTDDPEVKKQEHNHVKSLQDRAKSAGIDKSLFAAKKGDVLIWHADLIHGGNPVSKDVTRKSVVTHYCPKRLAPLFSEWLDLKLYDHDGHRFTTSYYTKMAPLS